MSVEKPIFTLSWILLLFFLFPGCGGGGGGGNTVAPAQQADLVSPKVYMNPDDGTLLSFDTEAGESFTYYGRKDVAGNPQIITELEYVDADGALYRIGYDASGVPIRVADENGTVIEFSFVPNAASATRLASREATVWESSSIAASVHFTSSEDVNVQFDTQLDLDEPVLVTLDQALEQVSQTEPEGNLIIRTTRCGEPATLERPVVVDFRYSKSSLTTRYETFPSPSEPGKYVGRIPVRPVDPLPEQVEGYCGDAATLVSLVCAAIGPATGSGAAPLTLAAASAMCGTLAVKVAVTPVPGARPAAAFTGAACEAFFAAGIVTCGGALAQSSDGNPDPIAGDNVLARMCSNVTEFSSWVDAATGADTAIIRASADFTGPGISMFNVPGTSEGVETTGEISVPSSGPFEELRLDHTAPVIEGLTFDPLQPDPSQGYTATAEFSCVEGSELSLLVQGEDGYGDGELGTALTSGASLSLAVAPRTGEPALDTFTVSAYDPITEKRAGRTQVVELTVVEKPPGQVIHPTADVCPPSVSTQEVDRLLRLGPFLLDQSQFTARCQYIEGDTPAGAEASAEVLASVKLGYDPGYVWDRPAGKCGESEEPVVGGSSGRVHATQRTLTVYALSAAQDAQVYPGAFYGIRDELMANALAQEIGIDCADVK